VLTRMGIRRTPRRAPIGSMLTSDVSTLQADVNTLESDARAWGLREEAEIQRLIEKAEFYANDGDKIASHHRHVAYPRFAVPKSLARQGDRT